MVDFWREAASSLPFLPSRLLGCYALRHAVTHLRRIHRKQISSFSRRDHPFGRNSGTGSAWTCDHPELPGSINVIIYPIQHSRTAHFLLVKGLVRGQNTQAEIARSALIHHWIIFSSTKAGLQLRELSDSPDFQEPSMLSWTTARSPCGGSLTNRYSSPGSIAWLPSVILPCDNNKFAINWHSHITCHT